MNIKDMSAEQRKEELARLADAVKAAKAETKTAKTRVAEGKDAVKGAKTAEEKAALKESLAALEAACQAASRAKVAEAVAREADFRAEAKAIEDAEKAEADQARRADPFKALAEKYAKAYPDCKAFHITSDRQVFLDKDKNLAQYHQKGLGEGEVRTINVR